MDYEFQEFLPQPESNNMKNPDHSDSALGPVFPYLVSIQVACQECEEGRPQYHELCDTVQPKFVYDLVPVSIKYDCPITVNWDQESYLGERSGEIKNIFLPMDTKLIMTLTFDTTINEFKERRIMEEHDEDATCSGQVCSVVVDNPWLSAAGAYWKTSLPFKITFNQFQSISSNSDHREPVVANLLSIHVVGQELCSIV